MEWRDEGVILSVRRHGETSAIAEILTAEHGRTMGLVRGGRSKQQRPVLQAGNAFAAYGERLPQVVSEGWRCEALPTAAALLRLAPALLAQGGALPAAQALPLYVRDKVAQTTAEREAIKAAAAAAANPDSGAFAGSATGSR